MKYILYLKDKNPINNQVTKCETAKEAYFLKKQAEKMGFKVTIKRGEKKNENI